MPTRSSLQQRVGVCRMDRDGQNYYRVEGHDVKHIQLREWMAAKPSLALFTRQHPGDLGGAGGGIPSFPEVAGVGAGAGRHPKKRRRDVNGHEQGWGRESARGGGRSALPPRPPPLPPPLEVIEVNDDDCGTGGGNSGEVSGLYLDAVRGGARASHSEMTAVGTGTSGGGCTGGGGGASAGARVPLDDALGVDVEECSEASESERGSSVGVTAGGSCGRSGAEKKGAWGNAASDGAERSRDNEERLVPNSYLDTAASAHSSRGLRATDGGANRKAAGDGPRRFASPPAVSLSSPFERRGGSWGVGAGEKGGGVVSFQAEEKAPSQPGASNKGAPPPSHEDLTLGDCDSFMNIDDDDDVQLVTAGARASSSSSSGSVAAPSPSKGAREVADPGDVGDAADAVAKRRYAFARADNRAGSVAIVAAAAVAAPGNSSSGSRGRGSSAGSGAPGPRSAAERSSNPSPIASGSNGGGGGDGTGSAGMTADDVAAFIISAVAVSTDLMSRRTPEAAGATSPELSLRRTLGVGARSPPGDRPIHEVDDDEEGGDDGDADPPPPSADRGKKHPLGVPMPFIGPAPPPPTKKEKKAAPQQPSRVDSQIKEYKTLAGQRHEEAQRDGASSGRGSRPGKSKLAPAGGRASALGRLARDKADPDGNLEWKPSGRGASVGAVVDGPVRRSSRKIGAAGGAGGSSGMGPRCGEQKMEDLTGADGPWQKLADRKDGAGSASSRLRAGEAREEATLMTIRGIHLGQDHFHRIVEADGWLTSQVIFFFFFRGTGGHENMWAESA